MGLPFDGLLTYPDGRFLFGGLIPKIPFLVTVYKKHVA